MKILCQKIISAPPRRDLGDISPWIKKSKEYLVWCAVLGPREGVSFFVESESNKDPSWFPAEGFEFINQHIPSSWVSVIEEVYGKKVLTMLPASWNYPSFFEDLDDRKPEAVELYWKEVDKMCEEEENFNTQQP